MAPGANEPSALQQLLPSEKVIGTCKLMYEQGVCNGPIIQVTTPKYDLVGEKLEFRSRGATVTMHCRQCGVQRLSLTPAEKN